MHPHDKLHAGSPISNPPRFSRKGGAYSSDRADHSACYPRSVDFACSLPAMAVKLFTLYSFLFLFGSSIPLSTATRTGSQSELAKHVETVATPILEVFQVYPPVLTLAANGSLEITDGSSNASVAFSSTHQDYCFQTLAVHSFAYSYGTPFVGSYNPPNCTFNRVTWNLTVTSSGTQYDRLGMVYLNSTEVFRTTTAEPTKAGIEWVYLKVRPRINLRRFNC